ncbi:MAG TPA: hypothetical protein PKH94_01525 [Bacteroidales bacterium]|nr:hypothetical protein [Bacteroidales bacterium]HNS45897.1 hypothetical protein [Bacteroidales bacterium]
MSIPKILCASLSVFILCLMLPLFASGQQKPDESLYIREYDDFIKVKTEYIPDTKNRLFEFRNVSAETLIVELTPCKYRPYLNEFDPLPDELFTKEGYDNYLEFEMKPGDIQWREFVISPVNVWKVNVEVRRKK